MLFKKFRLNWLQKLLACYWSLFRCNFDSNMPLDGILWLGNMSFCFHITQSFLVAWNYNVLDVVVVKSNLAVKYFNSTTLDNSFMFIIVNLPRPAKH